MSTDYAAAKEQVIALLKGIAKTAVFPMVKEVSTAPQETRFGGHPWLPKGTAWPEYDGLPMSFICQIEMKRFHQLHGLPAAGLMSIFLAEGYEEDGSNACIMLIDTSLPGALRETPKDGEEGYEYGVAEWISAKDHPHLENLEALIVDAGILSHDDEPIVMLGESAEEEGLVPMFSDTFSEVCTVDGDLIPEEEALRQSATYHHHCFERVKIGGYPYWMQGDETPVDSNGKPMQMVFQLHEDGPFGVDPEAAQSMVTGIGQVFWSRGTRELRYVWAC